MLISLEKLLSIPTNTFKVTLIIESVTAILELEEIIFAFKHRVIGVNTGKWNYMFSVVKRFKQLPSCFLPFRDKVVLLPD